MVPHSSSNSHRSSSRLTALRLMQLLQAGHPRDSVRSKWLAWSWHSRYLASPVILQFSMKFTLTCGGVLDIPFVHIHFYHRPWCKDTSRPGPTGLWKRVVLNRRNLWWYTVLPQVWSRLEMISFLVGISRRAVGDVKPALAINDFPITHNNLDSPRSL